MSSERDSEDQPKQCPECNNVAKLYQWVFVRRDIDYGDIFECPFCEEKMSKDAMEDGTDV